MKHKAVEPGLILVTGGAGFIGSHLCLALLRKHLNDCILCIDDLSCGSQKNLELIIRDYGDRFHFLQADVVKLTDMDDILYGSPPLKQIYHLACPASPKNYQRDPIQTTKTSFIGTLNMLELAKKHGARILYSSTSEVYGDPLEHPQKESYWGNVNSTGIRSCYDEGKRAGETLAFDFQRVHGVDIRVARLFNTYGPHMASDDGRVVSNFVVQALTNQDMTVYGQGNQTRSCCYVDDMVKALIAFMNQTMLHGPVNLGNPSEITIKQLAETVLSLLPESKSQITYGPLPRDDPKVRQPDISLAKTFWQPETDLKTGLQKTIKYFQQNIHVE